jgi:hypothetical protein
MSRKPFRLLLAAAALSSSACLCFPLEWWAFQPQQPTKAQPQPAPASTPVPLELNLHENSAQEFSACQEQLPSLLVEAERTDFPGDELPMDYTVVVFRVSGDTLSDPEYPQLPESFGLDAYQDDRLRQQRLWRFVVDILPAQERSQLSSFILFTDGINGSLGAIEQTDDPYSWSLQLDIQDSAYYPVLSTTLIHEFAHMLTVQDAQLYLNEELDRKPGEQGSGLPPGGVCDNYRMLEGCATDASYLNLFFDRFWGEIFAAWLEIDDLESESERDAALDRFYESHLDQFVSWYAPTNPEEDLAESFMYFVFSAAPSGDTLAEQKMLFFYDFPELVELRQQLHTGLCAYLP